MTIKDKFRIKALKLQILLTPLLGKMGLLSSGNHTYGSINDISTLVGNSKISIQLHKEDSKRKEYIFSILELLEKHGIAFSLIEFDKIFSADDLKLINKISPTAIIRFQYIYTGFYGGSNISNEMEIGKYLTIYPKIEFLKDVACANFNNLEDRIIFGAVQLSEYVAYDFDAQNKTKDEYMEISSLFGCLKKRKSICTGIAFAFERFLTELNTENSLAIGYDETDNKNGNKLINFNHVWNRLKLGTRWFNVDITNLIPRLESQSSLEKRVSTFLLSSDQTLEKIGIQIADTTGITPASKDYPGILEIYYKMKNIKNVLEQFDNGDRSLTLRYNTSSYSPTSPSSIENSPTKQSPYNSDLDK